MVLEHQAEMQNRLTRANYGVRRAMYVAEQDSSVVSDDLESVIDESAKLVVDYLLFSGEAKLESKVT